MKSLFGEGLLENISAQTELSRPRNTTDRNGMMMWGETEAGLIYKTIFQAEHLKVW